MERINLNKNSLFPAQWTVVHKPSVNNVYYGARTCICPTKGGLVLGSVYQTGQTVKEIDPVDTEDLWRRAKALFPELNKKQVSLISYSFFICRHIGTS